MLTGREMLFAPTHVQQTGVTGDSSRTLSSTLKLITYGFVARDTQLASIDFRIGGISGSPVVSIYLCASTVVSGQECPVSAPITSALASDVNKSITVGVNTASFGAHALTVGEHYWIVFQYVSGTSAAFFYLTGGLFSSGIAGSHRISEYCNLKLEAASSDEPITWTTVTGLNQFTSIRQVYTSGKTYGFLASNGSNNVVSICHNAETSGSFKGAGQSFTIPKGMRLKLKGFLIPLRASTTTATDVELYAECYINRLLVATSEILYSKDIYTGSSAFMPFSFGSVIKVPEDCELLLLVKCNYNVNAYYFYMLRALFLDNYAFDYMPLPLRRAAYYSNDGTGITISNDSAISCGLLLDADEPFYPPPINRRTSTGR